MQQLFSGGDLLIYLMLFLMGVVRDSGDCYLRIHYTCPANILMLLYNSC